MKAIDKIKSKILSRTQAKAKAKKWKEKNKTIVFTNGCFDILHYGHIHYLSQAKDLGDHLVIGLNSENSVKRLKGNNRPINDDNTRAYLLAALEIVDAIIFFEEDTPLELINLIQPNVLVKGGDYKAEEIVGYKEMKKTGGKIKILSFVKGYSTTNIENKIKNGI